MGNSCTCFEHGSWEPQPHITDDYSPMETGVYQDMTQPLSHYFISSGHNSYLTGDQLISASGTSTIEKCLKAGCRVVELDVYNGPVCKHGGTLTSPVSFQACIEAVRDCGFKASPYPVIITMETHTDEANQAQMAAILRSVLGKALYDPEKPDPDGTEPYKQDPMTAFKSPEELKGKVICRSSLKKVVDKDLRSLLYLRNTKCTDMGTMIKREQVVSSSFEERALPQSDELGSEEDKDKEDKEERNGPSDSMYPAGALQDEPEEDAITPGAPPLVAGSLQELYTLASRHLLRVYPAGWRITSSNYNPMKAWARGFSLAALNWQVWDRPLWCNEGKFTDNGGCGYVLKPEWMRQPGPKLPARPGRTLRVRVYCAHKFQGRNFWIFKDDLFVKLTLWGMPCDRGSRNTKTVKDSGRLEVGEDFSFVVRYPEMAVLCVQLMDQDAGQSVADRLGYRALPLSTLKEGEYKLTLRSPTTGSPLERDKTWVKLELSWDVADAGSNPLYSTTISGREAGKA